MSFTRPKSLEKLRKQDFGSPKFKAIQREDEDSDSEASESEDESRLHPISIEPPPLSKTIMKEQKKLGEWEDQDLQLVKAKPDKSLKHFADVRHEPDFYEGGALQTSPEIDFDLDDWDSH